MKYEKPPKSRTPKGDGFHYAKAERKPTGMEIDFQGDKLEALGYEPVEGLSNKQFIVYRIPAEKRLARLREQGERSSKIANSPASPELGPDEGRITLDETRDGNKADIFGNTGSE